MNDQTKKTLAIIGGVIGAIAIIGIMLFLWGQGARNAAIRQENQVDRDQANVQTIIQKRVDALTQMVNTVKDSKKFEQDTLEKVVEARDQAKGGDIARSATTLNAVAEQYPQLKTIDLYRNVMDETATVENQLSNARDAANTAIRDYNNTVRTFPNSLALSFAGYQPKEYTMFEANENAKAYDPTQDNLWNDK